MKWGLNMKMKQLDKYFPSYDSVGHEGIFKSANTSCWDNDSGYFADINAYILAKAHWIRIIDLTNAMIPGKKCRYVDVQHRERQPKLPLFAECETFEDVYNRFFNAETVEDADVYTGEYHSIRTFTPFKRIKPIKTPEKWTIAHVWKAMLSGQIYAGRCDGYYTDDYAYDAAVNFRQDERLHIPSFAKRIIESPDGWRVWVNKVDGSCIQLSVNCCTFDTNTLFFDEKETTWRDEEC